MKDENRSGSDGSKFDLRDSELQSMGEMYIRIHDNYLATLQFGSWDAFNSWINRMRVFNSYLLKYVPDDKQEMALDNREGILELDEKTEEKIKEQQRMDGKLKNIPDELIKTAEDLKNDLEVLRDAAGFTLPMNQKVDPESAGVDQL